MKKYQRIGYVRVSTPEQNPDNQLRNVELDKKFIDIATGKHQKRSGLIEMLNYIREGDEVFTEAIDRMARSVIDLHTIVKNIVDKQARVHFIRENMTFGKDASAEMILRLSMMGAIAEFERNILRERQREGILIAQKMGNYKGRKRVLSEDDIRAIRDQAEMGIPKSTIAKRFRCCRKTIYTYLK